MKTSRVWAICALWIASLGAGAANGQSLETEVNSTCRSPREAVLQHLYWLQPPDRVAPDKAAACMDGSRLQDVAELPRLATELRELLDGRGIMIDLDALPRDPEFLDQNGEHRFALPELPELVFVRGANGMWLLTPESVGRIDDLAREATGDGGDPSAGGPGRWLLLALVTLLATGLGLLLVVRKAAG